MWGRIPASTAYIFSVIFDTNINPVEIPTVVAC
jgi:hypothetical protein